MREKLHLRPHASLQRAIALAGIGAANAPALIGWRLTHKQRPGRYFRHRTVVSFMMLDSLRRFIRQHRSAEHSRTAYESPHDEIQLAATALLLELAYADGEFTAPERAHIEVALSRHFNLDLAGVQGLMALAEEERRRSIDHFQFTQMIKTHLDVGQRVVLAEVMWGVILADGRLEDRETVLLRKISNLLDVEPGYLTEARRRATPPSAVGR